MSDILSFAILSFTSLFTIIDPIAVAPVFVSITARYERSARRQAALKACGVAFLILVFFAAGGSLIFKTFGITINALRIAGGFLFFIMSIQMLIGKERTIDSEESVLSTDPAIVPLAMPLICGPGAISTIMVLMGQHRSIWYAVVLFLVLALVIGLTITILLISPTIVRFIGHNGIAIFTKIIAIIICTIGIQFIIDGVKPVVLEILRTVH